MNMSQPESPVSRRVPELVAPEARFRASFATAMDEFRAEGRGSPDDRTVIGRYLREHAQDLASDASFAWKPSSTCCQRACSRAISVSR